MRDQICVEGVGRCDRWTLDPCPGCDFVLVISWPMSPGRKFGKRGMHGIEDEVLGVRLSLGTVRVVLHPKGFNHGRYTISGVGIN